MSKIFLLTWVDFKRLRDADTLSLNLNYSRSWFQNPNSFDAQNATEWTLLAAGLRDLPWLAKQDPAGGWDRTGSR